MEGRSDGSKDGDVPKGVDKLVSNVEDIETVDGRSDRSDVILLGATDDDT